MTFFWQNPVGSLKENPTKAQTTAKQVRVAYNKASTAIKGMSDIGTSNFDAPLLLVRKSKALENALRAEGMRFWHSTGWLGNGYVLTPPGGQGATRTRAAEVMTKSLKEAGYDVTVRYQMD